MGKIIVLSFMVISFMANAVFAQSVSHREKGKAKMDKKVIVKDPVFGMEIQDTSNAIKYRLKGKTIISVARCV